jgi:hypothetical protein
MQTFLAVTVAVVIVGLVLLLVGVLMRSKRSHSEEEAKPKRCRKEDGFDARFNSLNVRLLQVEADVKELEALLEARLARMEGLLLEIQQELRLV